MPKEIKKNTEPKKITSTHHNQKRKLNIMEQIQILVYDNLRTAFLWNKDRRMNEDLIKKKKNLG